MYWPFQIGERIIPQYGNASKYEHDFGSRSTMSFKMNLLIGIRN